MSVHDPKYLSLRRKLDELKYPQTLHPDCVQLVDRLVKDLFKSMSDLDKQRKKKQSEGADKSSPTVTALYDQIDFLTGKNAQLTAQVQELRTQGNSDKVEERVRQLNGMIMDFKRKFEEKVNEYESTVEKLEQQIAGLREENRRLQKEVSVQRNISGGHVQELQQTNGELAQMIQKKNREIRELEESGSVLRVKVQVLEKNLEEARSLSVGVKQELRSEGGRIVAVLKQEVADYEMRWKQVRTELELSKNDGESLRRELQRAKDELLYVRREDSQAKNMESITKVGKEKMDAIFQETREALTQKAEECRQLSSQIADQQLEKTRLNGKLSQLSGKIKFLTGQNNDLQSQIQLISTKATAHLKRTRELQSENTLLQKQMSSGQDKDVSLLIEQTNAQLRQEQAKSQGLHREMVLKDREVKLLQNEVQVLREEAERACAEREKKVLQNKKLQLVMAEGSKNLQVMQLQKEELMKENRELKTGKQAIYSSDVAAKSELFLLREQLEGNQIQMEEVRALLKGEQLANRELQSEITKLGGRLKQSQDKNRQVFEDNKLMVGQIKLLEQRKLELHQKVKDLQERQSMQQDNHTVTRKEFQELAARYGQLERELAKKDQIVRVMDSDRDELQNQLDKETEMRANLQQHLALLQQNSRQITKGIDQRQYSLNQMERRLSKAESARDSMERQFQRQCEEVLELKDRLGKAEAAAREFENETNILALSNKEGQQQAERLRGRVSELDRKLKEKIRESDQDRERAMGLNIERTELLGVLQKERMQVVRLEGFLKQLQEANNSMFHHLQQKDHELEQLRYLIDEGQRKQQALLHEISSYQRNLEIQTNDYNSLQEELQRSERERETYRAERSWKKDVTANAQDWKIKQEERVVQLQQDYDRKRMEVEQFRARNRQLENLLNEERMRDFRKTQERSPLAAELVESRVQSYEGNNFGYAKKKERMKALSVRENSEASKSQSIQSAQQKMRMLEEMYMETIGPSIK